MSDTTQLKREEVKNEVRRIKKLPPEQREEQFEALHKRVSDEIETTCARIDNDQQSTGTKRKEERRLLNCVMAFPTEYRESIYEIYDKVSSEVFRAELIPYNVKKDVQRIKRLPKHEYEAEMLKLMQEIEKHVDSEKTMQNFGGRTKFLRFIETLPEEYEKELKAKYWSAFYVDMVHVSGLPLPEHAEVKIALQERQLSIISGSKEFALPMDRIVNMGATIDYGRSQKRQVGGVGMMSIPISGTKEYLTIEYEKEGETKHIVAYSNLIGFAPGKFASDMEKYFREIKKPGEIIKQEL